MRTEPKHDADTVPDADDRSVLRRGLGWSARNPHFTVAAVLLAVTAAVWPFAQHIIGVALHKEPVPWPKGVQVDPETFRLEDFPERFGPYRLAADGELSAETDGEPDGEVIITDDIMEALKIGTPLDAMRVDERRSNWYISRIYIDTRVEPGQVGRYWQLDVTYYTGGLDKVPHVPERCLAAAGATLLGDQSVEMRIPRAPAPWRQELSFQQTRYEVWDPQAFETRRYVQYYIFSFNGRPEPAWEMVRLRLNNPWEEYSYFAKIQFAPLTPVGGFEKVNEQAAEFAAHFMPSVLRTLPMPEDVEQIENSGG